MNAEKIYELLGAYLEQYPNLKEEKLEVILSEESIGPSAASVIDGLYFGFDWNSGRLLLTAEDDLYRGKYLNSLITKNKRAYKIMKYTNREGQDKTSAKHRLGRIVSEPIVDKKFGFAWMMYLYEKDGSMMFGKMMKSSPVFQIHKSYEDENGTEMITIITKNSMIYLEEVSCPL